MTQWGMNTEQFGGGSRSPAQYFINVLKSWPGWGLLDGLGAGTNEGWNTFIDSSGNLIAIGGTGINGSALTFTSARMWGNRFAATDGFLYPDDSTDGAGSWTFLFDGRGAFTFSDDTSGSVTVSTSTGTTSSTALNVTASDNGMKVTMTATGFSNTATFANDGSGNLQAIMTGHNFTAGTPVTFRGGTLPTGVISDNGDATVKVYYVLASGLTANVFLFTDTQGSTTPVAYTDSGSGTITGYGDWARKLALVRTSLVADYANGTGKIWNPVYVSKFAGMKCYRFMYMMNAIQGVLNFQNVTFSGTHVTWPAVWDPANNKSSYFRPGTSVTFQPNFNTDTLPDNLDRLTTYFIKDVVSQGVYTVSLTQGGAAIDFTAHPATGTINGIAYTGLCDKDITADDFIGYSVNGFDSFGRVFSGPPPEALVDLCYQIGGTGGCAAYVNIQPLSDTTWSDAFARRMYAKYAALGCSFDIYLEAGNEMWLGSGTLPPSISSVNELTGGYGRAGAIFPTPNTYTKGEAFLYMGYNAIKNMQAFKDAWAAVGGDVAKIKRVWTGVDGDPSASLDGFLGALSTVNGGDGTAWSGYAATHFEYYPINNYMASSNLPDAWTAVLDSLDTTSDIAKFKQEMNYGGLLFIDTDSSTTTTGTSAAFIVTGAVNKSGVIATDNNQQNINITFHTPPIAGATLTVKANVGDPGFTYPLLDYTGAAYGTGWNSQLTRSFVLTKATSAHPTGSGFTQGWYLQPYSWANGLFYTGLSQLANSQTALATFNAAHGTDLKLMVYEGGNNMAGGWPVQNDYIYRCNISDEMGFTYTNYLTETSGNASSVIGSEIWNHYTDCNDNSGGHTWGILESVMQTTLPKYAAYMALVRGGRGGKHLRRLFGR